MIEEYAITRKDLYTLIKLCDKTKDGYYWYPNFITLVIQKGNENDSKYYYSRDLFRYKLYFKPDELEAFLAEKKMDIDIDYMYRKSVIFYDNNKELSFLRLKDYIPRMKYKLYELIDCFEYIYR